MAFPVAKRPEPGKAQQIATALGDQLPIDAMGYPIGKSIDETAKAIPRPVGITPTEWKTALEVATEYFRLTSGVVPIDKEAMISASSMQPRVWNLIYKGDNKERWHAALAVRGIMKKGAGLTFDQLRCLRYLTDVTAKGDINVRLRKLGISWETFQNWQRDPKFNGQLEAITSDAVNQAQPLIMMELVKGSVEGQLNKIQYLHQLTGRAPKAEEANADIKMFMVGLIEVLQGEIDDPEVLRRVAERLTALKNRTIGEG